MNNTDCSTNKNNYLRPVENIIGSDLMIILINFFWPGWKNPIIFGTKEIFLATLRNRERYRLWFWKYLAVDSYDLWFKVTQYRVNLGHTDCPAFRSKGSPVWDRPSVPPKYSKLTNYKSNKILDCCSEIPGYGSSNHTYLQFFYHANDTFWKHFACELSHLFAVLFI